MRNLVVINNVSLDGVMQAPGRPDEDRRGGFAHGGWAVPYNDEIMGAFMGKRMSEGADLLLGRRTYEDFAAYWPKQQDNPFTDALNTYQKYVVSTTLQEPLSWVNSAVLTGNVPAAVTALKEQSGKNLVVLGSGELIQTLIQHELIDEYLLLIHPLVLGSGRRLFGDGDSVSPLRLVDSVATTTGVLLATYQPDDREGN